MWLTRISVRNPVFATMLMAALAVLGLFAYFQLRIENMPDVSLPAVIVQANYPGASPEIVENDVSRPIEESVNGISGIKLLRSRSFEGVSLLIVEFNLDVKADWALQQVRDKVALVRPTLRDGVKEPTVELQNPDDQPVISLSVTSPARSQREVTMLAKQVVQKKLQSIPGVGKVEVVGGVEREVRILLNPERMKAMGVSVEDVVNTIREENIEYPLGTVTVGAGDKLVQIRARLKDAGQFRGLIVSSRSGTSIRLDQVAEIEDGQHDMESVALVNGKPAVSIDIRKSTGTNVVELSDNIRQAMDALRERLPADVQVAVLSDSTDAIKTMLADVKRTLIEGALLTVVIVLLFLGSWRSTVITGLTLPVSLIGAFFALQAFGFTINSLTMIAMSLCIGLLIDDAIVVRENISRHAAMGKGPIRAALDGTEEIGMAVLGTTLTIVAVFLPVAFMGGVIGRFFFQFGVTVSAAVLISMLVSFTLDPMLSSVWYDPTGGYGHAIGGPLGRLLNWFERRLDALTDFYERAIHWSLSWRKTTLAIALGSFVLAIAILGKVGGEFVPDDDTDSLYMEFETPVGSSLEYSRAKAQQIAAAMAEYPEVKRTYISVNGGPWSSRNLLSASITLTPKKERSVDHKALRKSLRERLAKIGGIKAAGGGNMPLYLSIQGGDLDELKRLSDEVTTMLHGIQGVVDIKSSLDDKKPVLLVDVKREEAQDLGLNPGRIGALLRPLMAGQAVSIWQAPDGENYDVNVKVPDSMRASPLDMARLPLAVRTENGRPWMIELGQVADLKQSAAQTQIKRSSLSREVTILAGVEGRPLGDIVGEMQAGLKKVKMPVGYKLETRGDAQAMQESAGHAGKAMALAILFIYGILATQFRSFLQPFAIMSSLPLALIGVALGLFLTGSTLNIMSMIGIIMLMGLVTKNAILLIDFTKQSMEEGMSRHDAIVAAGRIRLRPILMTTGAMVLGMLPVAVSKDMGDGYASMANAVIGGVLASTLLTLVVVPVVFTYLDTLGNWFKAKLSSTRPPQPIGEEACSK